MTAVRRLGDSGRFGLRLLCATWLAGSASLLRLFATAPSLRSAPGEGALLLLSVFAAFGVGVLWRTRATGLREVVESSAALGFWAGVFAVIV
ncbi:MAG TPA: hypothetical protein VE007_13250 [Thermoanaerobaculia bacterium]|nr:hypothetical protein [Thermoanaerobaculia bacterium]